MRRLLFPPRSSFCSVNVRALIRKKSLERPWDLAGFPLRILPGWYFSWSRRQVGETGDIPLGLGSVELLAPATAIFLSQLSNRISLETAALSSVLTSNSVSNMLSWQKFCSRGIIIFKKDSWRCNVLFASSKQYRLEIPGRTSSQTRTTLKSN